MADALGLIYDVSKDLIEFAADFRETPGIIKSMTLEIQTLGKQLFGPVGQGLTKDEDFEALCKDLRDFVESLRLPDGKSRMRKTMQQGTQAMRMKSLHDRLTSLNRLYQAQVNARIMKSQDDTQESLASQKETLDHVDEQINAIRAEKLKALNAEVLHWLSPPANKSDKHALLVEKHHTGTGAWLYETDEFKAWESRSDDGSAAPSPLEEQIQTLWLYGKPGAGKSTMIAQIVKRLTDNLQAEAVVLRIYCDSKATESQTRLMLLKSVLRQAVEQLITQRKLPVYIENAFHVNNENLEVKECKVLLGDILGEFTECIVAIDGLDEYEHFDPHRNEGIDILDDLHQALLGADKNRCHSKKLLIASRENCLKFYESSKSPFVGTTRLTELEFVAPNGDVEIVVRSHLQHGGFSFKEDLDSNPEIFNEVLEKVCAKSENVFLVAHFHLQRLDKARSIRNLRENADGLPLGLNATWEDGLKSIIRQHGVEECDSHGQKEILGLRILAIVSKARRQLSIQELRHALAVEPRESSFDKYALLKNPDDIIKTTGGLLQIRQGDVDVFHKTLTDYLCRPDIRRKYFPEVDRLAEICLTYMNFTEFGEPCDDQAARREEFPLLQYAVRNIGYHVSDELARNPELLDDCLEFLRGPPPLGTFQVAVSPTLQRPVAFRMQKVREETPLLHMAVLFGMPFLLKKITMESETGSRGYKEETALHTAARAQQVEAATRLIDADADVNATSYSGKTPLDVIMNRPYLGFEIRARETFDVASILVEAAAERLELIKAEPGSDVTVDVEIKIRMVQMTAEDFQNMIGTDFRQKSKENAKDIAMLIALNDVSLDITDREGEIVMKLLDAGADVNSESMPEATALQLASIYGRQSIVKALLGKNANPFLTRSLGFTACDLARMREKYGKQGGQWKAVHEMLAEKMAEWQQKELDEPDEVKKLLIPGPKQAEQLEQKASDTYDLRMGRMFAESMAALGAVNDQPVETMVRHYVFRFSPGKPPRGTDDTKADPRTPRSLARLEIPDTEPHQDDSIFGANTPLPAASASRARSQERNNSLLEAAAAAGAPDVDDLEVKLGALNTN